MHSSSLYIIGDTQELSLLKPGRILQLELHATNFTIQSFKYKAFIIDSSKSSDIHRKNAAVFITPQGQERSWMFSNEKGLQELAEMAQVARLIVIHLKPGFEFDSLQTVQHDLSGIVSNLLQKSCIHKSIPFMTNENIGERHMVYSSARMIVEDVKVDKYYRRELIFLGNVNQVQSEVKLLEVLGDKYRIDNRILMCEYMRVMLAGMFSWGVNESKTEIRVCVLGAGAGCFSTFLKEHFSGVVVDAVEIDSEVLEVGERFFEFRQDDRLHIINQDAIQHISSCINQGMKYDLIFLDINGPDSSSTPPDEFRSPQFLSNLNTVLNPEGVLIFNTMLSPSSQISFFQSLKSIYSLLYTTKCEEDSNLIVFAYKNTQPVSLEELQTRYQIFSLSKSLDESMIFTEYLINPFPSQSPDISTHKKKRKRRRK